ncbi:two-component system, OmpR family, sensor histidine kinase ResE [Oceanobacillus limi]|uniref:histidine kinase n=1 Tax=Oceanobacillus limi TaxID=930131 RepID=A0A1H9ZIC1_9BACI|nr:ATP-binding protein [Oceanobacillus limi]SES81357.1 two-component system, OmpR family, sensor histidine kinase ResE [Oceanobacillus limi]
MFWRSVVGKLAITILLLVSFVLFILTILLLEFFENFHIQEAEEDMLQTATKVSVMVENHEDKSLVHETTERVKDPASKVVILFPDDTLWFSSSNETIFKSLNENWLREEGYLQQVVTNKQDIRELIDVPKSEQGAIVVGTPIETLNAAVFVYQSLEVVDQTKAETTKIIFLAAGIAIVLTTIFAFFLSTRITSPLIKMREAALDLTRGEFNTKVPILTYDEIGELAMSFNRMGRQLKFHINALRQEKEQLSSIVSSMADGVVTLSRSGEMLVINPPAERFLEDWYFEKNVPNGKDRMLPSELNNILQEVIQGEREVLEEISLQGRSYVMIMTPLYDQSYVRGAVAVIRDMTEERRLDKLRKDFIANVSHELRTPISMLQGYSEAIVDDIAESKEEKNELAQIIYEESLRLSRLVNELLDLARMEAGHIQLNKTTIEVEPYVNRIIRKFKGVAEENKVQLVLHQSILHHTLSCDPDRVEQVFTNLIDNAIRHTEESGYVKVTVENTKEEFSVSVEDSGSGIPEEDLPFVFERFYKADKSRTRNKKQKGTGLGLAIAKNIIDAHRGSIIVNSKLGVGTTFLFRLPNNDESFQ